MANSFFYSLFLACFIIGICLGFPAGRCSKPIPQCPEITTGKDTVLVQIVRHDTVIVEKTRKQIVTRSVPVTEYVTVRDTVREVLDTAQCYGIDQTMPDGALVYAELCSRSFSIETPIDLTGSIRYLSSPDTLRLIHSTDTVTRPPKPHLWRDIKIGGISFVIGGVCIGSLLLLGR
jgi:hypothetical protein